MRPAKGYCDYARARRECEGAIGCEVPISLVKYSSLRPDDRRPASLRWIWALTLVLLTTTGLMGGTLLVIDTERPHPTLAQLATEPPGNTFPTAAAGKRDRLTVRAALHGMTRTRTEIETSRRVGQKLVYVRQPVVVLRSPLKTALNRIPQTVPSAASAFASTPHATERLPAPSLQRVAFTTFPLTEDMLADVVSSESDTVDFMAANDLGGRYASQNVDRMSREVLVEIARRDATKRSATTVRATPFRGKLSEDDPIFRTVRPGETLTSALIGIGATVTDARRATTALPTGLVMGDRLKIVLARDGSLDHVTIKRVKRPLETLVRKMDGHFVLVEEPAASALVPTEAMASEGAAAAASLQATLDEFAITPSLREKILRILLANIPPETVVDEGASLAVVLDGEADGADPAHVRAISLRTDAERFDLYRHQRPDGSIAFLDPSGVSPQEKLLRKPIAEGRYTSGFGMRRHPVLKYRRLHSGTDYAAPRGTPIYAAGDGTVATAKWKGGNGRFVAIDHPGGFRTTYSHMSAFSEDAKEGGAVKRGDVIGYVGTTGLSTGNHLHVELKSDGRPVDLLNTPLPSTLRLWGDELADFQRNRNASDALLRRS